MHSIHEHKPHFEDVVEHVRVDLSQLRTGRANPALVEDVTVEAYGSPMPLRSMASIAVSDARTLVIEPWDKSLLKAVEKAIHESSLDLNPVVDSKVVRLPMPSMTEESRKNLVKLMKEKLEQGKVALRAVRERVREQILQEEKDKAISEDEKFRLLEELDRMTKEFTARIEEMGEQKEEEIMTL
ncbi:ribosome recycling factor [Candidatus Uhrbacteria bacterium]|nr:ribosome recycling factor [Candidatus Uhrbacteria bacterium]